MTFEKLSVTGSRSFPASKRGEMFKILDRFYEKYHPTYFISGYAEGVDQDAELLWAIPKNLSRIIYRPDYEKHSKGAPLIRNTQIVDAADYCIIFWDKKSRGTKDTIEKAKQKKKPLVVFDFDGKILEKCNLPDEKITTIQPQ